MGLDEVNELQREWRAIVLDKLSSIESGQKELKQEITDVKTTYVRQQALEALRESNKAELEVLKAKVDKLDKLAAKAVGITIGVQVVFAAIYYVFLMLNKH